MKTVRVVVTIVSILVYSTVTAIGFRIKSESFDVLSFILLAIKNGLLIMLYVYSIWSLKNTIREFN